MSVRMYNVGFGDAFLVSIPSDGGARRILFDCGSIAAAPGRSIRDVVTRIVADARNADGSSSIDVVVATHRHRDHVSGFESPAWSEVEVREVWMPWTEDPSDPAAREIRDIQSKLAVTLHAQLAAGDADRRIRLLVENALTNERAMKTLHSGFAGDPKRRFFPEPEPNQRTFTTDALPGITVHVLGPSRDKGVMRDMTPPAGESYMRLHAAPTDATGKPKPPFPSRFERRAPHEGVDLDETERKKIRDAAAFSDLDAAVALDQAVNGTSLMLVLEIAGACFLFPGDAQWGTWAAAMRDPGWAELLRSVRFYKVGHHGSENATPRQFVEKLLPDAPWAMVSTIERPQWANLPKPELLDALAREKRASLVRSDDDAKAPKDFKVEHDVVVEARIPLE